MSLSFAEDNKASEKNSHRNMEPWFKLRNNPYFAIPGHQFILHSPSHRVELVVSSSSIARHQFALINHSAVTYCFVIVCTYCSEKINLHPTISVVTFLFVHGGSWNNKKTVMPVSHTLSV